MTYVTHYYYNGPANSHAQGNSCFSAVGLAECNQFSMTEDKHYYVGNYCTWSSITGSDLYAFTLFVNTDVVTSNYSYRYKGFSIRCGAR